MTALLGVLLGVGFASAQDPCPPGRRQVESSDAYERFQCEKEDPAVPIPGKPGVPKKHKCPPGSQAVDDGTGQRARCVFGAAAKAPQGSLEVEQSPAPRAASRKPASKKSARYRTINAGRELAFEVPADWDLSDGWNDAPPSIYLTLRTTAPGKRTSIMVTRYDPKVGDLSMSAAFKRELALANAMDGGKSVVAGRPARFAIIPRENHTVYLAAEGGRYYTVGYSAPSASFSEHQPAFDRVLDSLKFLAGGEDP